MGKQIGYFRNISLPINKLFAYCALLSIVSTEWNKQIDKVQWRITKVKL